MLKNIINRLSKNSPSEISLPKYLWYATGEVALVVLGILIAIHFNNKNQENNLRDERNVKLTKLREVIYQDSISIAYCIQHSRSVIVGIDSMISLLKENITLEEYRVFCRLKETHTFNWRSFFPNSSIYNEMIGSGLFSRIEDEDLKIRISNFYNFHEHYNDVIDRFMDNSFASSTNLYNIGLIDYKYLEIPQNELNLEKGYKSFKILVAEEKNIRILENNLYLIRKAHERVIGLYSILINNYLKGLPLAPDNLNSKKG